jgi:hypothetical protein
MVGSLALAVGFAVAAAPAWAHHSFAAAFDSTQPVTVKGVIKEVRLQNPHSFFFLEATDDSGKKVTWSFEAATPTSLLRSGYKRDSIKAGDVVTIKGFHARDPQASFGAVREIITDDGRSFVVGPAGADDSKGF